MGRIEKIEYKDFLGIIEFKPFFDDSTPLSKQYRLTIEKDGTVFINSYGLTGSGAKTFFKRWVDKNQK